MTEAPDSIPGPAPTPPSAVWVFRGADGLRAGWGLLIFIALFAVLLALTFAIQHEVTRIFHKAVDPSAQTAALDKPHPQKPSSAQPNAVKAISPQFMLVGEGTTFLAVLAATSLVGRIERRPFTTFGLGGPSRAPQFLQGLFWGVLCLSALVAFLHAAGFLPFDARLLTTPDAFRYGAIWAIGFTFVAFLEETLLRGYIQYTLARGLAAIYGAIFHTRHRHALGFWTAAFVLSFVFGFSHGSNPGESPLGLVSAGTAGLVFCLALYRTGSLWWALGFHASWDWAQSFLYGVADSGTMVQGHLLSTHPVGKPILSGGLTGPEGSLFVLPTLAIAAAIIVLTLPRTHHPGEGLTHPDAPQPNP